MNQKKKILIITYYWYPSGGIGVQRCTKFTKYLTKLGWDVTVYTAKNATYPYLDTSYKKDIPNNIKVIKRPIIEPFGLFKKLSGRKKDEAMSNPMHVRRKKSQLFDNFAIWIRGNFFIPDARSLWIKPSVKFLTHYLKENPVDVVLSSAPAHTSTEIARRICQKMNIPFLADFRDPWTQVDYYKVLKLTSWADKKHKKLEQKVFQQANKITISSPSSKKDLESIGAKNVSAILLGYDEEDFTPFKNVKLDTKFTIAHLGSFGIDRKPDTFFEVLKELKNELPSLKDTLQLNLYGMIDFSIWESIEKYGLKENIFDGGTIERKKAIEISLKAQILLLPINKSGNIKGRIPGKLFENMRSHRPILCLSTENDTDVSKIIEETNTGKCFHYDDHENIKKYLTLLYDNFLKKKNKLSVKNIDFYSTENQVKILSRYLQEIIK